jgi:mono/diheme cytochrome c family protein
MTSSGFASVCKIALCVVAAAGAAFLYTPSAGAADSAVLSEQAVGKAIYEARCSTCHGPNGEGTKGHQIPATAPPLKGNPFVQYGSVEAIVQVIRHGRTGAKRHYDDTYPDMPSFDATMIEDIRPLIAYLKGDMQKSAAQPAGK